MTITRLTSEEINNYANEVYFKAKHRLGDTDTVSFVDSQCEWLGWWSKYLLYCNHKAFRTDLLGG